MLEKFLKKQNISIYKMAKDIKIPYSTLKDIISGHVDINKCQVRYFKLICDYLEMNMDELYSLLNKESLETGSNYTIKNKKFIVSINGQDIPICKANTYNAEYIKDMAKWELSKIATYQRFNELIER